MLFHAAGDGDVSSELTIRRTLPQREQPTRSTIRGQSIAIAKQTKLEMNNSHTVFLAGQDVNAVEIGEVKACYIPLPGQAELQPQPEIYNVAVAFVTQEKKTLEFQC